MNDFDAIADRIARAYLERTRISTTPVSGPGDLDEAYAVQRAVWHEMVGDIRPVAWKVAAPGQDAVPIAAPIFPSRLASSPGRFPREMFMAVGIEAEIALRFGRDLPLRVEPYVRGEIVAAIGSVHVAMELVDTRLADPEAAGPYWRLADNLLNGALVLGEAIPDWQGLDWNALKLQISVDGQPLPGLVARQPLGDIFHCLPWWIVHVGGARTGDIVTTGAWTGMHPAGPASSLAAQFEGLGGVAVLIS